MLARQRSPLGSKGPELLFLGVAAVGSLWLWWSSQQTASAGDRWWSRTAKESTHALHTNIAGAASSEIEEVRTTPPERTTLRQGQSKEMTWTVTGTTRPVKMRLLNNRPDVATLDGGQVQIVTSSGGENNVASAHVTAVSPGEVDITATILKGDEASREEQLTASFRLAMKTIADRLEVEARAVPVFRSKGDRGRVVRRADVSRFLDHVEAEVAEALPQKELAPFRDAVAAMIRQARGEVERVGSSRDRAASGQETFLLVDDSPADATINEGFFRSLAGRIVSFFRWAGDTSPIDTLCIVTIPENGADLVLYPPSVPSDRRGVRTASRVTLYLGRYAVEINGKRGGFVNLLLDPQRVVECVLTDGRAGQACRPVSGSLSRCP